MKVHEKIKAYIAANNVSMSSLSQNTGIPQDRLLLLLNGEEVLYAKDLRVICLALNISPEMFIDLSFSASEP